MHYVSEAEVGITNPLADPDRNKTGLPTFNYQLCIMQIIYYFAFKLCKYFGGINTIFFDV
jgi:hypothetical protein